MIQKLVALRLWGYVAVDPWAATAERKFATEYPYKSAIKFVFRYYFGTLS